MVAVGMNKAADELLLLDDSTREDLASGKYRDPRRGFFGASTAAPAARAPAPTAAAPSAQAAVPKADAPKSPPARRTRGQRARHAPAAAPARRPWTDRQERLALIYNQQGLRPEEIAGKLGVSTYLATQIILAARDRASR
jgi:hypothetical protein